MFTPFIPAPEPGPGQLLCEGGKELPFRRASDPHGILILEILTPVAFYLSLLLNQGALVGFKLICPTLVSLFTITIS